MRINKYLALHKYSTRRGADELIAHKKVFINGKLAVLGMQVNEGDKVEVKGAAKKYRYFAYYKPRGIITHSPQKNEESINDILPIKGVFPVGRLDKDSCGLMILTDDGRITDPLLNPTQAHEKEYEVTCAKELPTNFKNKMERGVNLGEFTTKPCRVTVRGERKFSIVLTEGKKHQIRRMCARFDQTVTELKRVRVMNIKLGQLKKGEYREIEGKELNDFLLALGV